MSETNGCDKYSLDNPENCTRLAWILSDGETVNVHHVCDAIAKASCANWLFESWPDYVMPAENSKAFPDRLIHIAPGHTIIARSNHDWPCRLYQDAGELFIVLRQWAEIPADENLIAFLEDNSAFRDLLETAKQAIAENRPYWDPETNCQESYSGNCSIQNRLAEVGLLNTPSMARYVIRRALNMAVPENDKPRRQILVTTFCIKPPALHFDNPTEYPRRTHSETIVNIAGSSSWITGPLLTVANKHACAHRDWWRDHLGERSFDANLSSKNKGRYNEDLNKDIAELFAGTINRSEVIFRAQRRYADSQGQTITDGDHRRIQQNTVRQINRKKPRQ